MAVQYPTPGQIREAAFDVGLDLTDDDIKGSVALT